MSMMGPIVAAEAVDHTAAQRMGELLWSAIRHGGLLDRSWWASWISGVQRSISIDGTMLAVELQPDGVPDVRHVRRWFADPITKILIVRWHCEGLRLNPSINPDTCLAMHLVPDGPYDVHRFMREVRAAWEFRLPGILLAYAEGRQPGASLPSFTWERVVYGKHRSQIADEPVEKSRANVVARDESLKDEGRALRSGGRSYKGGRNKAKAAKVAAAKALRQLPPTTSPVRRSMRAWCIFALEREKGRASIGFAPSTIRTYLKALATIFEGETGFSPLDAPAREVEARIYETLAVLTGRERADAIKAALSFSKFRRRERADDPIVIDLEGLGEENHVSPNVILPADYDETLRVLDRAGDADLSMLMILLFRTGLRIDEAVALRVGDVNMTDQHVELVVEANEEHSLKTKTSRRIIPLDVLLEPAERDRLVARVNERQSASKYGIEAWLFGQAMAASPPRWQPLGKRLEAVLRGVADMGEVTTAHLRHSFASYLLATLLLPADVKRSAVPRRLQPVVSPERRGRVADRLLGRDRLGGGALHSVSQVMGHTGPDTTLRYYCHLLDMSLGMYCNRPIALVPVNPEWMKRLTDAGPDARRKAIARAVVPPTSETKRGHARPTSDDIHHWSPEMMRKTADAALLASNFKRLARPIARGLLANFDQEVPAKRRFKAAYPCVPPQSSPYAVPWRAIKAVVADGVEVQADDKVATRWKEAADRIVPGQTGRVHLAVPGDQELRRFIDQRLCLNRRPRRAEAQALMEVIYRWRRGHTDIRLSRLGDSQAFVQLLGAMGFKEREVVLSLTSKRAFHMSSSDVHRFMNDRAAAPQLAGRSGWRGSLIVRLRPHNLDRPLLAAKATRTALLLLAVHVRAEG